MANLADCAFAVAKSDLLMTNGAIRKAREGEKSILVYKRTYKNGKTDKTYELYEEYEGNMWSPKRIVMKSNGVSVLIADGDDCKDNKVADELHEKGFSMESSERFKDVLVDNGWRIDLAKLHCYSYDYTPYVSEYDDHITVFFGGRWDFPDSLVNTLDNLGVSWQGAGCEDGMAWQYDEFGNSDFGLRIGEETEYCDGDRYTQHYVEDTSE